MIMVHQVGSKKFAETLDRKKFVDGIAGNYVAQNKLTETFKKMDFLNVGPSEHSEYRPYEVLNKYFLNVIVMVSHRVVSHIVGL